MSLPLHWMFRDANQQLNAKRIIAIFITKSISNVKHLNCLPVDRRWLVGWLTVAFPTAIINLKILFKKWMCLRSDWIEWYFASAMRKEVYIWNSWHFRCAPFCVVDDIFGGKVNVMTINTVRPPVSLPSTPPTCIICRRDVNVILTWYFWNSMRFIACVCMICVTLSSEIECSTHCNGCDSLRVPVLFDFYWIALQMN